MHVLKITMLAFGCMIVFAQAKEVHTNYSVIYAQTAAINDGSINGRQPQFDGLDEDTEPDRTAAHLRNMTLGEAQGMKDISLMRLLLNGSFETLIV